MEKRGTPYWTIIHTIPFYITPQNEKYVLYFFNKLGTYLFCDVCKGHYNKNVNFLVNDLSKVTNDTNKFFKYTYNLHNKVNKPLGKQIPKYDKAYLFYLNNTKSIEFWNDAFWIILYTICDNAKGMNILDLVSFLKSMAMIFNKQFIIDTLKNMSLRDIEKLINKYKLLEYMNKLRLKYEYTDINIHQIRQYTDISCSNCYIN